MADHEIGAGVDHLAREGAHELGRHLLASELLVRMQAHQHQVGEPARLLDPAHHGRDVLGVGRRAHLRLVGRLELEVAEREERRVGEREGEAGLDLLLAIGLEAELLGDLAQHRELLLGDLVHASRHAAG